MGNALQQAIQSLMAEFKGKGNSQPQQMISPLAGNTNSPTLEQTPLNPAQQAVVQRAHAIAPNMQVGQILQDYGKYGEGLFQGANTAVSQAMQTLNPKIQQSQAQPAPQSPQPTPTPFTKNIMDGYVMRTPRQYTPLIAHAAQTYNIPTSYLSAALARESMGFNPDVISGKLSSPAGAQGIAQFMPATAKGMGVDPLDPPQAINGMAKLLRAHYDQFGQRPDLALAAYNAGAGAVQQYGGIPPFPETQGYVKGIMDEAKTTYTSNSSTGN